MKRVYLSDIIHQMEELASDMRMFGFISDFDRRDYAARIKEVIELLGSSHFTDDEAWERAYALVLEIRSDYIGDIGHQVDCCLKKAA
jgi:hypothetical protein